MEVASDVFRALSQHLSLETFTLQPGKYKAQIGSTADNLDEQHVCFHCLTGLVQRCLCDIFVPSNKLEIQQDYIAGSLDPTPREAFRRFNKPCKTGTNFSIYQLPLPSVKKGFSEVLMF